MKVLALQLKRIGDFILTTPALAALHAAGARVSLVVDGACESLLPAIPGLEEKLVYHKRGGNGALWRRLRADGWDAVLDFTGNDRSALMALVSRSPRRITFDWVRARWWKRLVYREYVDSPVRLAHTCDHYLDLVRHLLGTTTTAPSPNLEIPADADARATQRVQSAGVKEPFILLHPGTARPEKYWVPSAWAELVKTFRDEGRQCAFTCGPDAFEQHHLREILLALDHSSGGAHVSAPILQPRDLLELAAVVRRARLVVSCDTSVVHFAAALRIPQVALFGPTNPYHWRPRHDFAVVLSAASPAAPLTDFRAKMKGAPMAQLPVALVRQSVMNLLSLAPSSSASAGTT
jgi:ADP-heptose:LPS heptosyltransferase